MGGDGFPTCVFWIGEYKNEGKFAKKLAKKVASAVK